MTVRIAPCANAATRASVTAMQTDVVSIGITKAGRSDPAPNDEIADEPHTGARSKMVCVVTGDALNAASLAEEAWSTKVVKACLAGL